jgi:hypothetical protein
MKINKFIYICLIFVCINFLMPKFAFCELQSLDESQMSEIYAEGFSRFYFGTVTLWDDSGAAYQATQSIAHFNIDTYQYTEIDSLKLGYHDEYDYKDTDPILGWDEDWTNVKIGGDKNDPGQDFQTKGLFFKAAFTNIDDPATRELKSITFGADYVQGPITADFNKFSGTIDDSADNTPEINQHGLNLGTKTITADPSKSGTDSSFSISLSIGGFDKGYWVNFTKATVTP